MAKSKSNRTSKKGIRRIEKMEMIRSIGVLLGSSWASGVNLYMSVAGLGIARRMNWLELSGDLEVLPTL